MADEDFDEIQNLLDKLDNDVPELAESDSNGEVKEPVEKSAESKKEIKEEQEPEPVAYKTSFEPENDPLDDLEDVEDEDPNVTMRPVDIRKMTSDDIEVSSQQQEVSIDLQKYQSLLNEVTDEILIACRADRQEAQDVITDLHNRLKAISNQSAPPKALVDGLVQAVSVKANINQTAVKMMDTNAKFLASVKSKIETQNNLNVTSNDLEAILNASEDEP